LNDGQTPNFRGARVHVSTSYNRVEGNRRASRNGCVSDLPPEIPNVALRIVFASLYLLTAVQALRNEAVRAGAHAPQRRAADVAVELRVLLNVTQRSLSVTQRSLSITQRALSVTQRALSVTQRALSVTQLSLSITQRALSVTQRALSITQRALSITQRALSVTQRSLSITQLSLSITQRALNVTQRAHLRARPVQREEPLAAQHLVDHLARHQLQLGR
jgi:hypothetical protein